MEHAEPVIISAAICRSRGRGVVRIIAVVRIGTVVRIVIAGPSSVPLLSLQFPACGLLSLAKIFFVFMPRMFVTMAPVTSECHRRCRERRCGSCQQCQNSEIPFH